MNALRTLIVLALAAACAGTRAAPCDDAPEAVNGALPICGVSAPEDMAAWGDHFLVVSSMEVSDHFYLLDSRDNTLSILRTELSVPAPGQRRGDADCAPPVYMRTHGIDLSRAADGSWQLLAVNHGARETVEMFELRDGSGGEPSLHWRGCVAAAENAQFNDVAALPDGGFLATDPITASWQLPRMLLGALGMPTGRVYRWTPGEGYAAVPNTEGAYPNGITLADDGQSFYLNVYLDGEVREHALDSGELLRRLPVEKPDNSTLTAQGELLVASQRAGLPTLIAAILAEAGERNRIPFEILAIDTESFSPRILYRHDGDALGGGTVAVPQGAGLYIGAFRGDRLLRVPMP
jgi:hypothetical protein